jgi:hypothetical protein
MMLDAAFLVNYEGMPFETLRIAASLAILAVCTYFDLFKDRNIPDKILYASAIIAIIIGLAAPISLIGMELIQGAAIAAACYAFYRMGYLGGAEMYIMPALAILLPIPPLMSGILLNVPFIMFILLFSGLMFAVTNFMYFAYRLAKAGAKVKTNAEAAAMGLMTVVFAAIYLGSPLFNPAIMAIVAAMGAMSVLYYSYKEEITGLMSAEVEIENAEEEVINPARLDERAKAIFKSSPVVTEEAVRKLREMKIAKIWVMKGMPPYMPFLLAGEILALLYSSMLLLF